MGSYRLKYIKDGKIITKEFNMPPITEADKVHYEKIYKEIEDAYAKGLIK